MTAIPRLLAAAALTGVASLTMAQTVGVSWSNFQEERWKSAPASRRCWTPRSRRATSGSSARSTTYRTRDLNEDEVLGMIIAGKKPTRVPEHFGPP